MIRLVLAILLLWPALVAVAADRLAGPVQAEVLRVLDGDTGEVEARIWLGQTLRTLVRIRGADTPELHGKCARERDLALVAPYSQLFWQGLNQALLLHREPARLDLWMRKARHAITAMEHAAAANEAKVIWALLPSFDLVFPERTQGLSKLADEVVRGGAQRRLRDALVAVLADMKAHVVDVETHFRADGNLALYAMDFHIYRRGHQQLFEALRGPIAAHLR